MMGFCKTVYMIEGCREGGVGFITGCIVLNKEGKHPRVMLRAIIYEI
jgi:hypothetical protein